MQPLSPVSLKTPLRDDDVGSMVYLRLQVQQEAEGNMEGRVGEEVES